MNLYLIGIDHKRADLDIREGLCGRLQGIAGFWSAHPSQEARVLATCNRIEVYGVAKDAEDFDAHAELFYSGYGQFRDNGYAIYGKENVLRHALRLVLGLESQLKGEREILQQLDAWRLQRDFPQALGRLWDRAIARGDEIRLASGLDGSNYSIADAVLDELSEKLDKGRRFNIVIIGTGKIAGLFAGMAKRDINLWFVANKNHLRARRLAEISNGKVLTFRELPDILSDADAVISATKSPHTVLKAKDVSAIADSRRKPLYMYDLAVPRDIDPEAGRIDGVVIKDLDDMAENFTRHNETLSKEINLAEYLIKEELRRYGEASHGFNIKSWRTA